MTALKTIGVILVLLATTLVGNQAFNLMNAPSNASVTGGVLILLGLLGLYIWLGPKVWRRMRTGHRSSSTNGPRRMASIMLVAAVASVTAVGCTRIGPGHVGIKVNNAGTYRGVEDVPISTGWVWYNPFSQSVLEYPTFVQTAIWTLSPHEGSQNNEEIDFNSSDQMRFAADVAVGYSLEDNNVPHFYIKFRSDDLSKFTHGFFRNETRLALNAAADKFSSEEILSTKKDELLKSARAILQENIKKYGVTIEQFAFTGAPRPPKELTDSINAKVGAIQKAQQAENELRESTANAKKAIAKADGEAQSNIKLSASLTPALLEWRRLMITELAIARWNGARPMVEGNTSGLLLNITPPKQ